MHHLLVVDDEPAIREIVGLLLEEKAGCRVTPAASVDEAMTVLRRDRPDAAIIDAVLPRPSVRQPSGLELASRAVDLGIPVLIISGEPDTQAELTRLGCPFLAKPFHLDQLLAETRALLEDGTARRQQLAQQLKLLSARTAELRMAVARARESVARIRRTRSKGPTPLTEK